MVSTALFQSGVVLHNGEMQAQLQAGAQSACGRPPTDAVATPYTKSSVGTSV
jgi:hypothetical protein